MLGDPGIDEKINTLSLEGNVNNNGVCAAVQNNH
jgi:hypothetical protein